LLAQAFIKFTDQVFSRGLFEVINACNRRGMSGNFGSTQLRSFVTAGRLMLTFARPGEPQEQSVSFVCTDDDPLGLGAGAQSVYTDLPTALDMLAEVATHWPADRHAQSAAFTADDNINLGF